MKKDIFKVVVFITLLLFMVALMVSFTFPDLFAMFYVSNWQGSKIADVYTMVALNKSKCIWLDATYPPLFYLTIGTYLHSIQKLGLLSQNIFLTSPCPVWDLISNKQFLFWVKFPFLITHLLSGLVFAFLFKTNRFKWFILWTSNPILLFVNFIMGQYETIPVLFTLLSLFSLFRRKDMASSILLGIGGAFKLFPFLVTPMLFIKKEGPTKSILKLLLVISVYLLTTYKLFINNTHFVNRMSNFNEIYKMMDFGINIGTFRISFYVVGYLAILAFIYFKKDNFWNKTVICGYMLTALYFITTSWFVQRIAFIVPWLLLLSSRNRFFMNLNVLISFGFFAYILIMYPGLFDHTMLRPILSTINTIDYSAFGQFINIAKTIVFSTMFFLFSVGFILTKFNSDKELKLSNSDIIVSHIPLLTYLTAVLAALIYTGSSIF